MAIYHCTVKTFSRSKGQSAVKAAAYRAGVKLLDERTGEIADYTKKQDVVFNEIVAPKNSPHWVKNPFLLWNKAEEKETRKNSTVAREFEIALPKELNQDQRQKLAKDLTNKLVDRFGFVAELSIHKPDDNSSNHHCHILATTRKVDQNGFTEKTRELDNKNSGAIFEVREMVANTINQHLQKAGFSEKVDHRTLVAQQQEALQQGNIIKAVELAREPTKHIGKNPETSPKAWGQNQQIQKNFSELLNNINNQISAVAQPTNTQTTQPEKPQPTATAKPVTAPKSTGSNLKSVASASNKILSVEGSIKSLENQMRICPPYEMGNILGQIRQLEIEKKQAYLDLEEAKANSRQEENFKDVLDRYIPSPPKIESHFISSVSRPTPQQQPQPKPQPDRTQLENINRKIEEQRTAPKFKPRGPK